MKKKLTDEHCGKFIEEDHECTKLGDNWIERINGDVYLSYKCKYLHDNIKRRYDDIKDNKNICSFCVKENNQTKDKSIISEDYVLQLLKDHNCKPFGDKWLIKIKGKTVILFICLNGHKSTKRFDLIQNKENICEECVKLEKYQKFFNELLIKINDKGYNFIKLEEGEKELTKKIIELECRFCSEKRNTTINSFLKNKMICSHIKNHISSEKNQN